MMAHVQPIRSHSQLSQDPEIPRPPRSNRSHTRLNSQNHDNPRESSVTADREQGEDEDAEEEEANAPPVDNEVTTSRMVAHYSGLVFASMIGCLIRLGLEALGQYDGQIIFALAWSQAVGCGIMGLALARKNEIIAWYPPLYTFLTTGIAGSVTTFSSWMLDGYSSFANLEGYPRSRFHSVVDGFAYSFATFAISMACLYWGEYVSTILPPIPPPRPRSSAFSRMETEKRARSATHMRRQEDDSEATLPAPHSTSDSSARSDSHAHAHARAHSHVPSPSTSKTPNTAPGSSVRRHLSSSPIADSLTIATAFLAYLIALLLYFYAPREWRHRAVFPILLSPPGAILRFVLAKLNPKRRFIDRFPMGTFLANMMACLIIAGMYVEQRPAMTLAMETEVAMGTASGNQIGRGPTRCNALYALQQGFCGCLSTVSTFVVEARAVRGKWKWIYVGGSVVLGHLLIMSVVGGVGWTMGLGEVCTG